MLIIGSDQFLLFCSVQSFSSALQPGTFPRVEKKSTYPESTDLFYKPSLLWNFMNIELNNWLVIHLWTIFCPFRSHGAFYFSPFHFQKTWSPSGAFIKLIKFGINTDLLMVGCDYYCRKKGKKPNMAVLSQTQWVENLIPLNNLVSVKLKTSSPSLLSVF